LVTAGAGSGKTRLLTHRIAHLISDCGVAPYNILAITFTNKAANEMKERIQAMLAGGGGVWVSTFHSMCVSMLRRYAPQIGYQKSFSIYGETEKERLIKKLLKDDPKACEDIHKEITFCISDAKNKALCPDEYFTLNPFADNAETVLRIYTAYQTELQKSNALDFDDLLVKTLQLLQACEEARKHYQNKFRYIHVDEFQDTNAVQYRLVKILAAQHQNVMAVGDEDQSIYGWRGANIGNIRDFMQDFTCKVYKLEQNYRSTKNILGLANKIIAHNDERIKKNLWTQNPEGAAVEIFAAETETQEAEVAIKKIASQYRMGRKLSDFAILMRLNALSRPFEEKLTQYGIPYKITGGFRFYDRKEIKDILAYLRLTVNPADNEAILRVINFPKRGIGDASVTQLSNYCLVENKPLYEVLYNLESNPDLPANLIKKAAPFSAVLQCLAKAAHEETNIADLTKYLVRLIDLKSVYGSDSEEDENRKLNIKELINSMEQFSKLNPQAGAAEYLQSVSLYSDTDELDSSSPCVQIATVHSAKGLEFDCVFVIGLEDGIFPLARSIGTKAEEEEERRLMYVAATRAKERLYLSYAASRFLYGDRKRTVPSRFLAEIGYQPAAARAAAAPAPSAARPVSSRISTPAALAQYQENMLVSHKKFGAGRIVSISGSDDNRYAEIEFENVGRMLLSLNYAPLETIKEE